MNYEHMTIERTEWWHEHYHHLLVQEQEWFEYEQEKQEDNE